MTRRTRSTTMRTINKNGVSAYPVIEFGRRDDYARGYWALPNTENRTRYGFRYFQVLKGYVLRRFSQNLPEK